MGRTVDDVALLLGVLGAPDGRDPMHRPIDLPCRAAAAGRPAARRLVRRPRRAGRGVAARRAGRHPPGDGRPRLGRRRRRARAGAGQRLLPGAAGVEHRQRAARRRFHDRIDQIKATIQDEIRRGDGGEQQPTWRRPTPSSPRCGARRWRSSIAATTCSPAPSPRWRRSRSRSSTRPRSPASRCRNYIDWMASCWRITVTGCPTLSLPAGFDADGLPVGVQLVTRQGADVALLRAAKALEEATGFAARRPPLVDRRCVDGTPSDVRRRSPDRGRRATASASRSSTRAATWTFADDRRRRRAPRRRAARRARRPRRHPRARRATTSSSPCSPAGTPARSPSRCTRRTPTPSCATCSPTAAPRRSSPRRRTARPPTGSPPRPAIRRRRRRPPTGVGPPLRRRGPTARR